MNAPTRFDFRISAYAPETIPMDRLAKYMAELAALMGSESHVHFAGLKKGSTILRVRVENEDIPKVESRLELAGRLDAPADVARPLRNLNTLLREDHARGTLKREGGAQIIKFPGCDIALPQRIGPIREAGVLDGELVRVGGKDKTIHLLLIGADGQEYKLTTTSRDVAKQLAGHLFTMVRVTGTGTWFRNEEGRWELESFTIQGFEPLGERTLIEAVAELREIEGSDWQRMDDPLATWRDLRKN